MKSLIVAVSNGNSECICKHELFENSARDFRKNKEVKFKFMHTLYHIDWVYSLNSKDYKIKTEKF